MSTPYWAISASTTAYAAATKFVVAISANATDRATYVAEWAYKVAAWTAKIAFYWDVAIAVSASAIA